MKILTVGETPCINSGFANVLRTLNKYFIEQGHEVRQLGWCHMPNQPNTYPYKIYPVLSPMGFENYFGVNIFDGIVEEYKPDIVFSLGDVYMLTWIPNMKTRNMFKWVLYTPIDSAPIPRRWQHALTDADQVITYSKYGYEELVKTGYRFKRDIKMYYHGFNTNEFYPLSEEEKKETRAKNQLEDKFIFGYVGTNSQRKDPARLLETWSKFRTDKKDVVLIMHTKPVEERQGYDLREAMMQYNLLENDVIFSKGADPIGGIPIDDMNKLYNMLDVFVTTTNCEGFGLPFLEAAACGVPSIAVDYSSHRELLEGHGELVKPAAWIYHRTLCQHRPLVDVDEFVEKMNKLYYDRKLLKEYSDKCIIFAKQFEWHNFLPHFTNTFDEIMNQTDLTNVAVKQHFVEV